MATRALKKRAHALVRVFRRGFLAQAPKKNPQLHKNRCIHNLSGRKCTETSKSTGIGITNTAIESPLVEKLSKREVRAHWLISCAQRGNLKLIEDIYKRVNRKKFLQSLDDNLRREVLLAHVDEHCNNLKRAHFHTQKDLPERILLAIRSILDLGSVDERVQHTESLEKCLDAITQILNFGKYHAWLLPVTARENIVSAVHDLKALGISDAPFQRCLRNVTRDALSCRQTSSVLFLLDLIFEYNQAIFTNDEDAEVELIAGEGQREKIASCFIRPAAFCLDLMDEFVRDKKVQEADILMVLRAMAKPSYASLQTDSSSSSSSSSSSGNSKPMEETKEKLRDIEDVVVVVAQAMVDRIGPVAVARTLRASQLDCFSRKALWKLRDLLLFESVDFIGETEDKTNQTKSSSYRRPRAVQNIIGSHEVMNGVLRISELFNRNGFKNQDKGPKLLEVLVRIHAYKNNIPRMFKTFRGMSALGYPPQVETMNEMIQVFSKKADARGVAAMMHAFEMFGLLPNERTFASVVQFFGLRQQQESVRRLIDHMEQLGVV